MGKIVSYDPNYRPFLWEKEEEAIRWMKEGLHLCHIVKMSEEELYLLTGEKDPETGTAQLKEKPLVFVSLGPKGAFCRRGDLCVSLPAYDVVTIDTNGAGDAFFGAILHRLSGMELADIQKLDEAALLDLLSYGNAAGSLTTTRKGAIPALPTEEEISFCRKNTPAAAGVSKI